MDILERSHMGVLRVKKPEKEKEKKKRKNDLNKGIVIL